jgi:peptidoglycan/LPS O-acetylase OafA/YrhL
MLLIDKIERYIPGFLKIDFDSKRIFGLDILRALAILFVVAGHGAYQQRRDVYFKYIDPFVYNGVGIFFVLSGFLIGRILIKKFAQEEVSFKTLWNFWIRRWFRTVPNYAFVLIVVIVLNLLFEEGFVIWDKLKFFLFSQNLFYEHPAFLVEAWSVSVEEWFYLITPITVFLLMKVLKCSISQAIITTAITIIISVTLFRLYRYVSLPSSLWDLTIRKQVFTRLDSLMYGVIGAYISMYHEKFWKRHKLPVFIIGILIFLMAKFYFNDFRDFYGFSAVLSFTVTSVATLFLLPFLSEVKTGKGFFYKFFTYISLISYSMYLVNLTIVTGWILPQINWTVIQHFHYDVYRVMKYDLYWLLTILISVFLYKCIELPMMKLRDKF